MTYDDSGDIHLCSFSTLLTVARHTIYVICSIICVTHICTVHVCTVHVWSLLLCSCIAILQASVAGDPGHSECRPDSKHALLQIGGG